MSLARSGENEKESKVGRALRCAPACQSEFGCGSRKASRTECSPHHRQSRCQSRATWWLLDHSLSS